MSGRKITILAVVAAIILVTAAVLSNAMSGGEQTFLDMAGVLKTHDYIVDQVGSPAQIVRNDGPWKVSLASNGVRRGFYSITAKGPKGEASLKAYWLRLNADYVAILAIYRTKPFAQDELVWGKPPTNGW